MKKSDSLNKALEGFKLVLLEGYYAGRHDALELKLVAIPLESLETMKRDMVERRYHPVRTSELPVNVNGKSILTLPEGSLLMEKRGWEKRFKECEFVEFPCDTSGIRIIVL